MDHTTDNLPDPLEADAHEEELAADSRKRKVRSGTSPTKWKRRRRPPRRNRKPSRPDNHIGLRNNGRMKRL